MGKLKYSQEIIRQWAKIYLSGKSIGEIVKITKYPATTIIRNLKKIKIKLRPQSSYRKYSLDETMFEKINTPNKAYFLGLLMADGCVSQNQDIIKIALQEKDKQILEDVKTALNIEYPLRYGKSCVYSCQGSYILSLCSLKVKKDLIKLGCNPKKSLTLKFPKIDKRLFFHFIRGYFDGDGCITYDKRRFNEPRVIFCSSHSFCKKMKIELKKQQFNSSIYKKGKISSLHIRGGAKKVFKFLDLIYKNADLKLDRKYQRYIDGKAKSL